MSTHRYYITLSSCLIFSGIQPVFADGNSWQMTNLFHPSPAQLDREKDGRVMIYHGVKDIDIDRAMEEQFERIETMMFTGTIVTDNTGQPQRDPETDLIVVEDDGC